MSDSRTTFRPCLCEPAAEIAAAARFLNEAVSAHLSGQTAEATSLIQRANMPEIRAWTESLAGPKEPAYKAPGRA